ncbi:MAG TPA: hypothetical protein VJA21_31980 [Verrucomicrobiae bacterium]
MSNQSRVSKRSMSGLYWFALSAIAAMASLPGFAADSLDHWSARNSGTTRDLNGVAWGTGRHVCVGASGTIVTSTNGSAWQTVAPAVTKDLFGVTYADGRFVAVGAGGAILASTNGLDWEVRPPVNTNQLDAVAFGAGMFVAVGGSKTILVSTDAVGWNRVGPTLGGELTGVAYGNGIFVAVGNQRSNPQIVMTSTNGTDWRDLTAFQRGVAAYGVAFGSGLFLELDARGVIYGSTDGITWKQTAFMAGGNGSYLYGITWAQGSFVAVGGAYSGASRKIATSVDGVTWKLRLADAIAPGLRAVGYGNGYFIAVGKSGAILQSDPIFTLTPGMLTNEGFELELAGEVGRSYIIQALMDPAQPGWQDLVTITNTTGTARFTDAGASNAWMRLYRALSP